MNPLRPTIQWEARSPHSLADDSMLQMYFGQTSAVQDAKLRPLGGGRSGARVYIAAITAEHSGMAVPLQPELVKIAADDCEVQNFRAFAEGTALVYGLKLARPPHVNPATGEVVFGFQLFESGADVSPLSALALADPGAARECLVKLISQLGEWYGVERSSTGAVTLPKGPAQIKDLIDGLARLSAPTARAVERSLDPDRLSRYPGVLTRVHGDLHLDNILAPRDGAAHTSLTSPTQMVQAHLASILPV